MQVFEAGKKKDIPCGEINVVFSLRITTYLFIFLHCLDCHKVNSEKTKNLICILIQVIYDMQ